MESKGTLILIGMPLGNADDISLRAKERLAAVDLLLCEDTRVSGRQLGQLGIQVPLLSYHQHNEASREQDIIARLKAGDTIGLVTDAGMPAISDPGSRLVAACVKEGIVVTAVPGPSAGITALALSGLDSRRYLFEGFLAPKGAERKARLAYIAGFPHTIVLYEAPHRLVRTLNDLAATGLGDRKLAIARELTKRYEEVLYLTVRDAILMYEDAPIRGEFVLVLEGKDAFHQRVPEQRDEDKADEDIEQFIREQLQAGQKKTAIRKALEARFGMTRNDAYDLVLSVEQDRDMLE